MKINCLEAMNVNNVKGWSKNFYEVTWRDAKSVRGFRPSKLPKKQNVQLIETHQIQVKF